MVADVEELEAMDASEIYSKRLNAKEVIFPKEKGEFIFPVAGGRIKFVGGDQELRTSTLIRQRPIQGKVQRDLLGESEGSVNLETIIDTLEQHLATQWIQLYASETKTFQETDKSLRKFLEQTRKSKVIYTHIF